eukprot:gnl/TRDRNA2_/TRDRNA2_167049_c0_seq2.p1 gnl/TRDRNA2_/TRDRNA2_167049_c0~~gnl/TRDRNA2_/TRDRNA2_167049_c0_seq2.p1  ORF type:complete len:134 (+),score=0.91 gnl/TRDRNA2_/TRDRNA2_167049_c0_seq2:70-471(+)
MDYSAIQIRIYYLCLYGLLSNPEYNLTDSHSSAVLSMDGLYRDHHYPQDAKEYPEECAAEGKCPPGFALLLPRQIKIHHHREHVAHWGPEDRTIVVEHNTNIAGCNSYSNTSEGESACNQDLGTRIDVICSFL